ncbi:MAG: hypothetical protein K2R98_24400 [Gemmataceae bacterium]|nr:hypothetical protein [Gemmataceae bacterium]
MKTAGELEPIDAYRSLLASPAGHDYDALARLALYLMDSGHGESTLPLWAFLIEYHRRTGDDSRLHACLGEQGWILQHQGDQDGAMVLHKEKEVICRRINEPAGLQRSLGNQAAILEAARKKGQV